MQKKMAPANGYHHAFSETLDEDVLAFINEAPARWGRMPPLSRAMVVEAGRALIEGGMLERGTKFTDTGLRAGLIGATTTGSRATDLDFADTLRPGLHMASPALFGYTLPNIPLSEAANHYGLTGPVYAIFPGTFLLAAAVEEAKRWLAQQRDLLLMLACAFDDDPAKGSAARLSVTFTIVR